MPKIQIPVEYKRLFDTDWREVPGYEGLYWISANGDVVSKKTVKKLIVSNKGYYYVELYKNNKRRKMLVHRMVAQAFIPNPNGYPNVCHKDDNPKNNKVANLFWGTQKMNVQDMVNKKRNSNKVFKGEENGFAKLLNKDIPNIRMLLDKGWNCKRIAELYMVDRTTISLIKRGVTWKSVK